MTRKKRKATGDMVLADGRGRDVSPRSEAELLAALRDFDSDFRAEGEPRIAVLWRDSGHEQPPQLSIGLGADECVVCYDDLATGDGGCSRGRRSSQAEVSFAYGNDYSFFPAWMLISKETALAAAAEFFRTGRCPANVEWKDVGWQPPKPPRRRRRVRARK